MIAMAKLIISCDEILCRVLAPLVRAMKEDEDEMEFNNQDNVMETEKPVKQEQQPVRPVLPPDDQPKVEYIHCTWV